MVPSKSDDAAPWHLLKVVTAVRKANTPPLYFKCEIEASGSTRLALHLTDLVTLYSCRLSKADIIDEATRHHSPIDPSSSAKQFDVLLNYVSQSLQGKDNTIARAIADDGNAGDGTVVLKLRTTTSLPPPLPALSFTFTLHLQSATDFSSRLLWPILHALKGTKTQTENLLDVIHDKDHVIERLLERVGNQVQGDMSLVFPVLTGSKDRSVKEAEKTVKGLKSFEKTAWQHRSGEGGIEEFDGMFDHEKAVPMSNVAGKARDDWLQRLADESALDAGQSVSKSRRRAVTRESTRTSEAGDGTLDDADTARSATESEDEFERQATPPNARDNAQDTEAGVERVPARRTATRSDGSTNASDEGPPAKKRKSTPPLKGGKLGGIGKGKKQTAMQQESHSSSSDADPPAQKQDPPSKTLKARRTSTASTASTTASEDDVPPRTRSQKNPPAGYADKSLSSATSSLSPSPSPTSPQKPTPRKRTRLGGLKKGPATVGSKQTSADPGQQGEPASVSPPSSSKGTPSRKLGRLNARKQSARATTPKFAADHDVDGTATPSRTKEPEGEYAKTDTGSPHRLGMLGLRRRHADGKADNEDSPHTAHLSSRDADTRDKAEGEERTADQDLDLNESPRSARRTNYNTGGAVRQAAATDAAGNDHQDNDTQGRQDPSATGLNTTGKRGQQKSVEVDEEEEETPEQAAERRRNELKKTAAAAPARKKRRF